MDTNDVWDLCSTVQGGNENHSYCYCCGIKVFRYFLQAPSVENTWSPTTVIPKNITKGVFICNFRICCTFCRGKRNGNLLHAISYDGSLARNERITTLERCMDVFRENYDRKSDPRKPLLIRSYLKAVIPKPIGKHGTRDIFRNMKGVYHFNYGSKPQPLQHGVIGIQFSFLSHNSFVIVNAENNEYHPNTVTVTFKINNVPSDLETKLRSLYLFHRSLESCTLRCESVENISLHLEE